ncbi:MAG: hypothetical protein J6S67_04790 [Methanobrevibacter sp.]|nr:hypothetical protein [Methanobrevibacter sp.]
MRNVAEKVTRQLCDLLNNKGIKTESDFVLRPIDKTLRPSWYVEKLKQCGFTDCIHVGISDINAFFAVTDDGHIMTGGNFMILDAFAALSICEDYGEFIMARPDMFHVLENEEETCIITDLKGVRAFFDQTFLWEEEE